MKHRLKLLSCALAAALVTTGMAGVTSPVRAQEEESNRRETRQVQAASQAVYDKITEAQELMEAGDINGAFGVMRELENDDGLSSYERVLTYQMLGYLYAESEEYGDALQYFERMIAEEDIPPELRDQTLYTMAQLYLVTEEYQKSIDLLQQWFSVVESPSPQAYMMLAQAYMQMDDFQKAKEPAETGLALGKQRYANQLEESRTDPEVSAPEPVQENWYAIVLATAFETRDYTRAREILEELLQQYPKRDYWIQLSGISSELGNEMDQLGAMEAAHRQGLLTRSSEIENLAQLYMYHDIPIKGAWVLEDGMDEGIVEKTQDTWELLANAYYNAQEMRRTIEPLRSAAELSDDGDLYVRLGQSFMDLADWESAATAFGNALDKGGLENPGEASLYLGMSHYNSENFDQARSAFRSARDDEKTRQSAMQWLNYLQSEEERRSVANAPVPEPERAEDRDLPDIPN